MIGTGRPANQAFIAQLGEIPVTTAGSPVRPAWPPPSLTPKRVAMGAPMADRLIDTYGAPAGYLFAFAAGLATVAIAVLRRRDLAPPPGRDQGTRTSSGEKPTSSAGFAVHDGHHSSGPSPHTAAGPALPAMAWT